MPETLIHLRPRFPERLAMWAKRSSVDIVAVEAGCHPVTLHRLSATGRATLRTLSKLGRWAEESLPDIDWAALVDEERGSAETAIADERTATRTSVGELEVRP